MATSALSSTDIATSLRDLLKNQSNADVLVANVSFIDKHNKIVTTANGETFSYDYLVLAPGSNHSYFNNQQWEQFAPGLKSLNDANHIRDSIMMSFENAERTSDALQRQKFMTFVIIGGGPTGVEMAGAIAELAHDSLKGSFKKITPGDSIIYLIESTSPSSLFLAPSSSAQVI